MHACAAPAPALLEPDKPQRRPPLEVADIFRAHGEAYRHSHVLTDAQRRVMHDIQTCRTAALGGHVDVCDTCGDARISYNSCRNRHCPKCQCLRQARWVAQRMERVLPTQHFHVVFTVPQELKSLALRNRARFFDLLFDAAFRTLLELGQDPKRLGGLLGITAVLHTWTRSLAFHPHLHCIVTGGGLSADGTRWVAADRGRSRYLFPFEVMASLFRGKLLAALADAVACGQLALDGACAHLADPVVFARLKDQLYRMDWVVYCKRPFGGAEQVFKYLGRYTHRVGISNQRLISVDKRGVTFFTKHGATDTLAPDEFIRRFLLHVLPKGFVKIRHSGLLAPGNVNTRLQAARRLLEPAPAPAPLVAPQPDTQARLTAISAPTTVAALAGKTEAPQPAASWRELFFKLTGIDLTRCRVCGTGTVIRHRLPPRTSLPSLVSPRMAPDTS